LASTKDEHLDLWREAHTFEDFCELTAKWIEGKLKYYPLYGECIDSETIPLRGTLAEFNRRGFLTMDSQPAQPLDEHGCGQRAYVMGYACEDLAKRIASLTENTDLLVLIFEPGVDNGHRIWARVHEFHPVTCVGGAIASTLLSLFEQTCGEAAMLSLKSMWRVIVIDLQWGRKTYLWEHVRRILKEPDSSDKPYSVTPASA